MKRMLERSLAHVAIGTLLTAMNALAATATTVSANKPLQFTSGGHIVGFTSKDVVVATGSHALRIEFVGAQAVEPVAAGAAATGSAAPDGKAAPLMRVTYPGIWRGITLVYDAPSGLMRSTYTVAPGADPAQIRLRYNAPVAVEPGGGLRIAFASGTMSESAPIAWQERDGRRVPVSVGFRKEAEREVSFTLGPYDKARPLTIDPTLTWNTFLGGASNILGVNSDIDEGLSITLDASGNVYVSGTSVGTWGNPIRPISADGYDVFAAKLDSTGALIWNTFLGGGFEDKGNDIAVDASGNVYISGKSKGAWGDPILLWAGYYEGQDNQFVAKLDTNGTLLWNTFLGVATAAGPSGIAVDASGSVYVTGTSLYAWGDPISPFIPQQGSEDFDFLGINASVAKLNTSGTLLWNTFLGGDASHGHGIAVDASGNVYVTGRSDVPWGDPIRPFAEAAYAGLALMDAFVAKLDTNGTLLWNTFLGGRHWDYGFGIAVDTSGNVYISGVSLGTWGIPIHPLSDNLLDDFAAKIDNNGVLLWNTFLNPIHNSPWRNGIAVDGNGNVYFTGTSTWTWGDPIRPLAGWPDAFFAKLNTNGVVLGNTFLGGTSKDLGYDLAVDASSNVYVIGESYATWGDPISPFGGSRQAFVAKITSTPPAASDQILSTPKDTSKGITLSATDADGDPLTYSVVDSPAHGTLSGTAPDLIYQPAANFVGSDSFTFKANDGRLDSSLATVSVSVTETTAPTGSVLINNGAASTSTAAVTLNLSATDAGGSGLASMRFRNNTVEPYSAWEPYQATKSWTLVGGVGTVRVYAQFADNAGNLSDANPAAAGAQGYMDAIELTLPDTIPPTGTIQINSGAASTSAVAVTLNLTASDGGGSGVVSMRFRTGTAEPYGAWEPYKTTKSWTLTDGLGAKKVYVQFIDEAENISDANPAATGSQGYMDAIELVDGIAPTGTIQINDGAASTGTTAVTLNLSAADTGGSGLASMHFRNTTTDPYSEWEPYALTKAWTLTSGTGGKKVYVQFKDTAGNVSDANPAVAGAQAYSDGINYTGL